MAPKSAWLQLVPVAVVLIALAVPINGHADPLTINSVTVNIGGAFTPTWVFPVSLGDGQTLVLGALTPGTPDANGFDTSERGNNFPTAIPTITVSTSLGGSQIFTDTTRVLTLTVGNVPHDPINNSFQEAQPYRLLGSFAVGIESYDVFVAYADNIHTDACGAGAATLPGLIGNPNCLPAIFNGTQGTLAPTFFQGVPGGTGGLVSTNPNHCNGPGGNPNNCWDSGVIMIVAHSVTPPVVPEPSTLVLLASGLFAVAGWKWRARARK